ncbi:MAG: hypothetical protein C0514_02145 [Candidatus Puniceispirillum sp.]|nr:hypothetical protein [Candidatus Puniceispirillum sp.]
MTQFFFLLILALCAHVIPLAAGLEDEEDTPENSLSWCVSPSQSTTSTDVDTFPRDLPHGMLLRQYIADPDRMDACAPLVGAERTARDARELVKRLAPLPLERLGALSHAGFEPGVLIHVLDHGHGISSNDLAALADLLSQRRVSKHHAEVAYIVARFQELPAKVSRIISKTVPPFYVPDVMRHAMCFAHAPKKLALVGPLMAGSVRAPDFARAMAACPISVEELTDIVRLSDPLRACHFQGGRVYPSPARINYVRALCGACEAHHVQALSYELSKGFLEGTLDDAHLDALVNLKLSPLKRICALRLRSYLPLTNPNYSRMQVFLGLMEGFDESSVSLKRMRAMSRVLLAEEGREGGRSTTDLARDIIHEGFDIKVRHKIFEWYRNNSSRMARKHLPFVKRLLFSFSQERHPTLLRALGRGQAPWQLKALTVADLTPDQILLLLRRANAVKQENWILLVNVLASWERGSMNGYFTQADYIQWACEHDPDTFRSHVRETHRHVLPLMFPLTLCAVPD